MNATYLNLPDGTNSRCSMCTECGRIAPKGNFDLSEKCCTCYLCGQPLPKELRGSRLYHSDCDRKLRLANEAKKIEKAELTIGYTGPVYLEGVGNGSFGDGFFSDVFELSEHLDFLEGDRPKFAYCCTERGLSIDLDTILENATEDMHEDCWDDLEVSTSCKPLSRHS